MSRAAWIAIESCERSDEVKTCRFEPDWSKVMLEMGRSSSPGRNAVNGVITIDRRSRVYVAAPTSNRVDCGEEKGDGSLVAWETMLTNRSRREPHVAARVPYTRQLTKHSRTCSQILNGLLIVFEPVITFSQLIFIPCKHEYHHGWIICCNKFLPPAHNFLFKLLKFRRNILIQEDSRKIYLLYFLNKKYTDIKINLSLCVYTFNL